MHSSRMRTGRSLTVCCSLLPRGGVCSGGCLLPGGVPGPGGSAPGGVPGLGWGGCSQGGLLMGGLLLGWGVGSTVHHVYICLTSVTGVKCGVCSTLCWKVRNISGST